MKACVSFLIMMFAVSTSTGLSQPATRDSLGVDEAVKLVLMRNPAIQEARSSIEASSARAEANKSGYYPRASIDAAYTRLEPIAELDLPGFGSFRLFPANNYDVHLGVQQMFYDFNRTSESVTLAKKKIDLATDALETVTRDLAFRTVQHFYAILFLQQSIQVQDTQIRTLKEHLVIARNRVASGTSTDLEVLTTQVRVAAAESRRIELENALHKQVAAFRSLAGYAPEQSVNLRGEFSLQPVSLNQDSLLAIAIANRIEAKAASDAIESAALQQRLANTSNMPSINGVLAYGFKNGYIPNLDVLRGNIVAGVEVKVPIFDGNLTKNMVEEAEANVRAADSRKRNVLQAIQSEVEQAVADVRAAMDQLQVSEVNIQQAQKAAVFARTRYGAGTVPNLDLLDAETALAQAEFTHVQALYSYVIGSYQLQRAIGARIY